MKLIIDIDEDRYDKNYLLVKNGMGDDVHRAVANGTPLEVYCDTCEIGNPCLYCKHEFESQERSE